MVQKDERYNIRVLDRAFTLLTLLSDGTPRLLTELSTEAGLNSSTTFRLLNVLSYYSFVERDEARKAQAFEPREIPLAAGRAPGTRTAGADGRERAFPPVVAQQARQEAIPRPYQELHGLGRLHARHDGHGRAERRPRRRFLAVAQT